MDNFLSFVGQASNLEAKKQRKGRPRSNAITFKGGLALLICFVIGIAAAALLLYTLL